MKNFSQEVTHIVPLQQPEVEENLAAYQATREFYSEVEDRLEFQRYCEWYQITAENHRQELEKMRGELNIFQWFRRR